MNSSRFAVITKINAPYEAFIGLRYVMSKRRNRFISFISLSSVLSIALGVIVLTTVLSVINGFEKALTEHLIGMEADATIIGYDASLDDWEKVAEQVQMHPGISGVAPYVQSEAMVVLNEKVKGVSVRGVLPEMEPEVSFITEKMIHGNLDTLATGQFGMIIGADLMELLNANEGDRITVVSPSARATPAGIIPRLKQFTVVGVYDTDMYEYDSVIVFTHLDDAARFFRMGTPTGLRLKTTDVMQAPHISREALLAVSGRYGVIDWTQRHVNYFLSVKMTKKIMFIILALIIAVATFNIISTLMMMVTDKQADIAVLRTLGASSNSIMKIFIIQGVALGLTGIVLGVAGGVGLASNIDIIIATIEHYLQLKFLSPDVYYITELPSDLRWEDVFVTALAAFLFTVTATVYPAWRAARTQPAEALRYE